MNVTTLIDATSATIIPHGEIDHTTLPKLRAVVAALPRDVAEVVWDLKDTPFIDTAGLHLLVDPPPADVPPRRATVTGMQPQPLRVLRTAAELFPTLEFARLLPEARQHGAAARQRQVHEHRWPDALRSRQCNASASTASTAHASR
ncbi:STAS domain-containing protein [Streptomyces sp. NPDC060030]|uniref:STAS domain-containing protein n=1 Tax=Streptomyces sp. NPDC060030 TaxID=3347042 RepID=UPI0036958A46